MVFMVTPRHRVKRPSIFGKEFNVKAKLVGRALVVMEGGGVIRRWVVYAPLVYLQEFSQGSLFNVGVSYIAAASCWQ